MSVKSMIRPALQALGLAAFFAMSLSAQAAPATLSFSSDTGLGDGVASDGDGGSVDIPSKSIEVLNIADTAGTSIGAIHWRGPGWGIPSALTYDDGLSGTTKGMAIRAGDGAEFRLVSFDYLNWGEGAGFTNTVVGYRDGTQVASMNFAGYDPAFLPMTITLSSDFNNVDDVRMFISAGGDSGGSSTWHSMNNIVIDDAVVPAPPTVTDAHISISGASGTGGVYKIGDTVTATWNNTAGGDNNTGVSGVTVDFSQFGGGAAVAGSNSSGTWTATYTITAGAIDTTNRNVSVTATNAVGPTTTADTSNAVVDSVATVVSNANIAISGATGTGGAFKIGDTVTATWNNTAGGDNNSDTISAATVDFGQFGGGNAVAATNSAGTWSATYTVVSGAIDASNRNVSVTAADNAGNATTTADTTNATVDNIAPAVGSVVVSGAPASTDTAVAFTVTFNESVSNFSTDDFTLTATGSAAGTIASVSAPSGTSVNVNLTGITGDGTLKVNLNGTTNIVDDAGNGAAAYSSGATHTVAIPTEPDAPTIGTATAGDGQVSVSFTAPADDGGSAITGYTVTSSPGGVTATGASSPITVTGLTNGTAYTFTVTATNAVGASVASAASNPGMPKASQTINFNNPGAQNFGTSPTLTATSSSTLVVTFSSSTTGVCTITSGGALTFVTAGSCTIDADQAGNAATNAASTVTQTFAVNAIVPGAPTVGTATAGDTQATVTFTAPASSGGAAITGYTVTASPGGATATGAGSPITVTGLTNGMPYTFTMTATSSAGIGAASAASNTVTPAAPQMITFANPGTQNFGTSPTLTATSDSGLTPTFTSATTGVCTVTSGGALTFASAGTCTINADQAGNASYLPASQVSQSFTVSAAVPGAPTAVDATAGDTQALVTFTAPVYTGGAAITGYTVTSSPGGLTATGGASPITVSGLTNGVAYTFSVIATNAAGTGSASAASNTVTPAAGQTITFANPGAQNFGTSPTLSATADSGLAVSFTSATTGVCTITPTGALTFVTAGTCTINADQPGDASHTPALQVGRSFTVNAVVPGAPAIGTASIAGPDEVAVAFTPPAFTGGASITGYTVTSTSGGITATGAGSPITVTGLTAGTAYAFTVAATNVAGTGNASAASSSVTPVPALVANAVSVTVAYEAGATNVGLDITGTPTAVAIASTPAHGIAAASGTAVTYQPMPGYAGTDSFTYTASDAYTTSAPATVTVTVAAPSVVLDAAAPATATGGTAYSHEFVASGGAAPYTFKLASGALPDGLTLSGNGELSGTPTEAGSFDFTVDATDSSTGTGPFSVQRAYTLVVESPAIAFALMEWPDAIYGDAFDQNLEVTGGTAPYTFEITDGALPQGVSLGTAGMLSGTPGEAGRFDVTVEVRDANGFTAQQAFQLVAAQAAQAITEFTANPSAPVFAPDGTFAVTAQGGVSGNPLVFASTTPAVCTVQAASVTMRAAGRCSLTADQAGDANFQAASQVRLDIDITAAVPTLVWPEQLSKMLGESAFALDNPESPSAGAFTFTSSQADVASIDGRTVTLHGEGVTVITATQAAAGNYTSASIEMRLTVIARPDPTRDPGVTGLLQAQVDASVRFAAAQQSNIRDRLRQVRGGANTSSSNLTLTYAGGENSQGLSVPLGQAATTLWPSMPQGWGAWLSGTATVGSRGRMSGYDFDTDGITLGADRAVGDNLLLGIAGSLANNDSRLDANGASRMQADQRSLALYGLWRTGEHVFVDAVAGTGRLDFDINRWSTDVDALGTATREGDQWFGSVSMGYEHRGTVMTLTGYGRLETSRTTLDAYREHGLDLYDLAYRQQVVDNRTAALGLEGSYLLGGDTGRIRPFWSLEYREALEDKGDAAMNYVVLPRAADYRYAMRSYNDHALSLSAGLDVRMGRGWLLSLLLGHEQARQSTQSSSIGLRLSYGGQSANMRSASDVDAVR